MRVYAINQVYLPGDELTWWWDYRPTLRCRVNATIHCLPLAVAPLDCRRHREESTNEASLCGHHGDR